MLKSFPSLQSLVYVRHGCFLVLFRLSMASLMSRRMLRTAVRGFPAPVQVLHDLLARSSVGEGIGTRTTLPSFVGSVPVRRANALSNQRHHARIPRGITSSVGSGTVTVPSEFTGVGAP